MFKSLARRGGMQAANAALHVHLHIAVIPPLLWLTTWFLALLPLSLSVQVHWVFGAKLQNTSVTLRNASLNLLHEDPPRGALGVHLQLLRRIAGKSSVGSPGTSM